MSEIDYRGRGRGWSCWEYRGLEEGGSGKGGGEKGSSVEKKWGWANIDEIQKISLKTKFPFLTLLKHNFSPTANNNS